MKHFLKRIQSKIYEWWAMLGMVVWDVVAGVAFICVLNIALWNVESMLTKVGILTLVIALILLSLVVKYVQFYGKQGRDDVTGGKNKKEFERVCSRLLKGEGEFVVVYANIDRFKLINDAYGDDEGDVVLKKIHQIIDEEMLSWDEASGRIMADNFGMLMRFLSMNKLEHRLARINEQLSSLKDKDGVEYGIKLYFGIYQVVDKNESVSAMLEKANLALKRVTHSMQHLVHMGVYDEKDKKQLGREKELEMKMERALRNGEFIPYLQPKYELENETIGGAEALVRWMDPVEGMIVPNEFIPLFEKNGFIVELDLYMFEQVCRLVEKWNKNGYRIIPISVNMSRGHFSVPGFFERYMQILSRYDVPDRSIEIELTESLFYNEMSMLKELIDKIHEAGMLCSIDDFGSGYSSLNILLETPFDVIKLDKKFIENMMLSEKGRLLLEQVVSMAGKLDLGLLAEGVETKDQIELLQSIGCDQVQGYYYAKPMPEEEFFELLKQQAEVMV